MQISLFLTITTVFSQKTSQGVLSSGTEQLGSEIKDLSSQSLSSLSSLNTKLESENSYIGDVSEVLINAKITELEIQLEKIEDLLSDLNKQLETAALHCEDNLECGQCTALQNCVWCTIEKICVPGNSEGPDQGECSDFLYKACSYPGCEEYVDCEPCIGDTSCGWCSIGHLCYEATAVLKGDCSFKYFYHSEGNTDCPVNTLKAETGYSNDELILEKEIDELSYIENMISQEIQDLDRKDIVKDASKSFIISDEFEGEDYDGIVNETDTLAENEKNQRLKFQENLWNQFVNTTDNDLEEAISEDYEKVLDVIGEYPKS